MTGSRSILITPIIKGVQTWHMGKERAEAGGMINSFPHYASRGGLRGG